MGILSAPALGLLGSRRSREKMGGVEQEAPFPRFSLRGWWEGAFQKGFEDWYRQSFGFRKKLVRTANQINFSLFSEITWKESSQLVLGKENQLFQSSYIDAHLGRDLMPHAACEEFARDLKAIQDRLSARGIAFLFFITPGKASVYPEYLPRGVSRGDRPRNYDILVPLLRREGVNTLDGLALALALKETSGYPVFPRGGAHWNHYASLRVTQELISRMESLLGRRMTRLAIESCQMLPKAEGSDDDLVGLANLWRPSVFYGVNPYPTVRSDPSPDGYRPNVLLVGGSFLDLPYRWLSRHGVVGERTLHDWYFRGRSGDVEAELSGRDIVILEANEAAMGMRGYGFIEAVLGRPPRAR